MTPGRRLALAIALAGAALAAWIVFTIALVASTLEPAQRRGLADLLAPRFVLLVLAWAVATALVGALLRAAMRRYADAPARLLEHARVLLAAAGPQQVPAEGSAELRALAQAFNALAGQRDALRTQLATGVAEASREVQAEKNRLAALMSELAQSVVACDLDGRITLYNQRARRLFREFSGAPSVADGAELIGIGRSIYAVFDRQLVTHAIGVIEGQLERGEAAPAAQFVTVTGTGRLLRAQMAPVRDAGSAQAPQAGIAGFVLMLEDVTRSFEEEDLRDRLLHGLTERQRASLAHVQAGLDALAQDDLAAQARERKLAAVRAEVDAMAQRLAQHPVAGPRPRWPMEDMLATDLLAAARRRMEAQSGRPVAVSEAGEGVWLRVESFTLIQALAWLAARLVEEFDVRSLQLRLRESEGRAQLDLVWSGHAMSSETVASWETEPMRFGGQSGSLSVRDVLQRHGGQMWFERERRRHEAFFRFLLPLAGAGRAQEAAAMPRGQLPQAVDFALLAALPADARLDDTPLSSLAFTVFDTETTGLEPSRGDEIIQIGAVRIVHGRLLAQESFEQLVDPGRPIPAATIPIHGITPAMVAGQPRIEQVLPTFHTYARDTVLVAHNAAFDMRFLQLLQQRTGLVFDQPVLDTLLLSVVVHPYQASHRLEAIAERFNIPVRGRHTALGDAMLTAEVLLRLIPLLRDMGVHTLRQAREASQRTYQARLRY